MNPLNHLLFVYSDSYNLKLNVLCFTSGNYRTQLQCDQVPARPVHRVSPVQRSWFLNLPNSWCTLQQVQRYVLLCIVNCIVTSPVFKVGL